VVDKAFQKSVNKIIFDAAGMLFWFAMTFYVAEILRRICLFVEEINHIKTRYEGSISRIILHVFGSRPSANFAALLIILSLGFVSTFFNQRIFLENYVIL